VAQALGRVSDIPEGKVAPFHVEGTPIAVANVEGRLFAFDDLCTHKGCSLTTGQLDSTSIKCPCHGSVFRVTDGSVINGPATRPLGTYEVQLADGEISIPVTGKLPADESSAARAPAAATPVPALPSASPALAAPGRSGPAASTQVHNALASVPLFADLDDTSIDTLESFAFRKQFAVGEVIVEEGRTGNGLYVVLSGSVEVIKGLGGTRPQRVAVLGPGEPFGEMALLGDWKRSASVRAIDDVECVGMDRWAFLAHLKTEPNLAIRMLQMLAERLCDTNARLAE
jgi:3-phenylpropionate/trans-cinnamate dioxygenase ferredoxin subunit